MPPNGWNCRCSVVQVRKSKYPVTDAAEARRRGEDALRRDSRGMFRFNPGTQQKTVLDYNPYTISACRSCPVAKGKSKLAKSPIPPNQLCDACRLIHKMVSTEKESELTPVDKKKIKQASKEWAERHLPVVNNHGGQPAKRLLIHNEPSGLDFVLNKKFFGETFSNCVRANNTAETMELAIRLDEWFPNAIEIRTEPGRDHDFDFKVLKAQFEDKEIEIKAKITGQELILYTMRVYK